LSANAFGNGLDTNLPGSKRQHEALVDALLITDQIDVSRLRPAL